ncbi:hypothetical protein GGR55DRAFT_476789 [Xylaria sp. FL0064]|nr:hypothetical protein GGR55DRAFT_476789 [Xylaria sp. FL0064]
MRYFDVAARPLVVCALSIVSLIRASSVLTFSDQNCRTLSGTINVTDTTGSGECTRLTKGYESFMIGTLGEGCSVTIYGHDKENSICSATNLALAEPAVCYNSTWIYFSVDVCSPPSSISQSLSTSTLATSASSTTSTTTPTTAPEHTSSGVNVGAVVGGTISGVFVLALVVGAGLYFFWFRPKHQRQLAEMPANSVTATSGNNEAYAMSDTHVKDNPYTELPDDPRLYELSPQYIAEVHETTHERHELPP